MPLSRLDRLELNAPKVVHDFGFGVLGLCGKLYMGEVSYGAEGWGTLE